MVNNIVIPEKLLPCTQRGTWAPIQAWNRGQLQITRSYFLNSLLSRLYICRETFTNQPRFMQNKANLLDTQNERN